MTGTEKKTRGPATEFGQIDHPAQSISLTKLAKDILLAAAERTGRSRSNVVEGLLRKYGPTFEFDEL
jgi:hypothetical protein